MARLTDQLNQIFQEAIPEAGIPEMKNHYTHFIREWGSRNCLITGAKEPKKWWFYNDDWWWYVISSDAVATRDHLRWWVNLWITIGDAMLDAEMTSEQRDTAKKAVLFNIGYGMDYAIQRENN